jgi:hypothetical protein
MHRMAMRDTTHENRSVDDVLFIERQNYPPALRHA